MRLIGTYGSPFVRRVGVTLHLYGIPFEHAPLMTGADRAAITAVSPLGRIPALVLPDGGALTESSVIVDYLDEQAGDAALTPRAGEGRRRVAALTAIGLATADKYVAAWYETAERPPSHVWQPRLDRLQAQIVQGLDALEAALSGPYLAGDRLTQADVTALCAFDGVLADMPDLVAAQALPKLRALRERLSAQDAFRLTAFD